MQQIRMDVLHCARGPGYIEGRVEREKGLEQTLLAQK